MSVASRETRAARQDLSAAQAAEHDHRSVCIDCIRAVNRRRPADRCAEGRSLTAAMRAAEKRWRDEQEADLTPAPGQQALF